MPGRRGKDYKRHERVNPDRLRQLTIGPRVFGVEVKNFDPTEEPALLLTVGPNALRSMDLTTLTTSELQAFQRFIDEACEEARTITRRLDAMAEAAAASGDTGWKRLYRPEPVETIFRTLQPDQEDPDAEPNEDPGVPGLADDERSQPGDDPVVPE